MAMAVPRFTISSLMVAILIASVFMLATREVGWESTTFCTITIVVPSIGISAWQKLGILGAVVASLTSASWCLLYLSVAPGVVAPFVNVLAAMMLWCFTQSLPPGTRVQMLIRQTMWGTISFPAALFLSLVFLFIWTLTFG